MPKLGTVKLVGESGNSYEFNIWSRDTKLDNVSAVYALSNHYKNGEKYRVSGACIGESQGLGTRIANHEKWPCADQHDVNSICVHQVSSEKERMSIETDLIRKYSPPCNDQ